MQEMPTILIYKCQNSPVDKLTWLACFHGKARGEAIYSNFTGETEQEAKDKAIECWNRWTTKRNVDEETGEVKSPADGRSLKFTGSVWCYLPGSDKATRIPADQWPEYEAKGYVRGKKVLA
jgi:hypothetical protein